MTTMKSVLVGSFRRERRVFIRERKVSSFASASSTVWAQVLEASPPPRNDWSVLAIPDSFSVLLLLLLLLLLWIFDCDCDCVCACMCVMEECVIVDVMRVVYGIK